MNSPAQSTRRRRAPKLRAALAAATLLLGCLSTTATAATPTLAGFWQVTAPPSTLRTEDGKAPPLNKAGRALHGQRLAMLKAGDRSFDSLTQCLPHGLPRLLLAPYPIEVLEERRQITFLHEAHHMPRLVYLDEDLPPADEMENNYMGASVGRWNGNTLEIRSAGFNDLTTLDASGLPHSTQMTLLEQIERSADGTKLVHRVTVTDPVYYTRPWTFRLEFRRLPDDSWLKEFVCTDRNPDA